MKFNKRGKTIVSIIASTLAVILVLSIIMPATNVSAVKNKQIDGMVFWGTSGLSRLYGDMVIEDYNEGASRTGNSEVNQHIWTTYHTSTGGGYGYLNLGKFTQHTVSDAPNYAILADWHPGWSASNPADLRVSAGQGSFIGDTQAQYWDFSGGANTQPADITVTVNGGGGGLQSLDAGLAQAESRGWFWDAEKGEAKCKTAVVIWAGEDWVVRNQDSSDVGLVGSGSPFDTNSGRKILQVDWMGLDLEDNGNSFFDHNFNPAPWANGQDPVGDVLHGYQDGGSSEVDRVDPLTEGEGIYTPEHEDVLPDDHSHTVADTSERLSGSSQNNAFHHMYTYDNSYMITDEHMSQWQDDGTGHMDEHSGFSYNADNDGIDVTLEHVLENPSDQFPDGTNGSTKMSLPQQAGQCFARVICGYNYQVEYLVQDAEQIATGGISEGSTDVENPDSYKQDVEDVWTGVYTPASYSTPVGYPTTVTDPDSTSSYTETITDGEGHSGTRTYNYSYSYSYQTDNWVYSDYEYYNGPLIWYVTSYEEPSYYMEIDGTLYGWAWNADEYRWEVYGNSTSGYYRTYYNSPETHYVYNLDAEDYYPPRIDWVQEDFNDEPSRCDNDGVPNYGYADSWHNHMYGGLDGEHGVENAPDTLPSDTEHYDPSGMGGNGSGNDHSDDYTKVKIWYTNMDKPIMKPVQETRHVKGYAEWWRSEYGGDLKIYVFGLGPYSKAIYEDQMDEYWNDATDPAYSGRDTNNDGEEKTDDRVTSNNRGTAAMNGLGPTSVGEKPEWLIGGSTDNSWDTPGRGGQGTVGNIDEIARTKRIDQARKSWNSTVQSNLSGAKFVDIWDITLDHTPYFRYQSLVSSGAATRSDAMHGKWYDKNMNNWVFHMFWSTILNDNPNPDPDEPIDLSLYSVSCALTSYANTALSPAGRKDGDAYIHTIDDVLASGVSGSGAVLGYGDKDYDFTAHITTDLSETSSTVDYSALLNVKNAAAGPAMYAYARYGHLLQDMGIDKTGEEATISPRWIPGLFMSAVYVGNSALGEVWDLSLEILKAMNPFQLFADASLISTQAKMGMYDESDGWLVQLAGSNPAIQRVLQTVGNIYDTLTGTSTVTVDSNVNTFTDPTHPVVVHTGVPFSVTMLYLVLFVAGFLLFYHTRNAQWHKTRLKALLIRVVFIVVGIPMLGTLYTGVLNGAWEIMKVTASPSSQMVAATFVDFESWVKEGRLSPPTGGTFVSDGDTNYASGHASDDTLTSLRRTAWAINSATGTLASVDMSEFAGGLTNFQQWDQKGLQSYEKTDWKTGLQANREVFSILKNYMTGEYYYSSDFESETMAMFSNRHHSLVGRHKGVEEDTSATGWDTKNTLYQMFENTSKAEDWLNREPDENRQIFTNTGEYASGSETNWSQFNIYANGSLSVSPASSISQTSNLNYSDGGRGGAGVSLAGLDVNVKTGLSTLSMYNYLNTVFGDTSLTVYSPARTPNGYTTQAHYKVNMIGSGALEIIFYLNCFAFMFAGVIVGFAYSLRMVINVLKRGFQMLMGVPGALLGLLGSIAAVIAGVLTMIIEIIGSMLLYEVVSELLLTIVTLFESPITAKLQSITASSASVGGLLGMVHNMMPSNLAGSIIVYSTFMVVTTIGMCFMSYGLIRLAPAFMRVFDKAVQMSFAMLCRTPEQAYEYLHWDDKVREPYHIPVPSLPQPRLNLDFLVNCFVQVVQEA